MKWYYPENGELPKCGHNGDNYPECLCELKMDEDSILYEVLAERFIMMDWDGKF